MKKLLLLFIILCGFLGNAREYSPPTKTPKIGLSLSGGGAKGFAHIGVLKVLDSLGVKIDHISGTSMGAIVGGLYASGYSGKEIEKIMYETDFYALLANQKPRKEISFFDKTTDKYLIALPIQKRKIALPSSISTGQNTFYILKELFKNVSSVQHFSDLPIPFMCVATNLETGEPKIFEEGDLVKSIMASAAFPSLLDPVKIGDAVYVDGAMSINYPSQPLKEKGVDIVIGVNLSTGLSNKEQITNIVDILNQIVDFGIQKSTKKQLSSTDISIHPNLQGMKVTSFDEKRKILSIGYNEALKYTELLDNLPKRKPSDIAKVPTNPIYSNLYKIDSLSVNQNFTYNQDYIQGKMGLKVPSVQTFRSINKMVDKLYATNNFSLINYDILHENGKNILKLSTTEIDNQYMLKFGLHYDEIFKTGLLMNTTIKRFLLKNSILSLDIIVGGNTPRYYFNYFVDNGYIPGFGLYSSGMSFELKNNDGDTYETWRWLRNEAYIQSIWRDKFAIGGGLSVDYFESKTGSNSYENKTSFVNPYVFIKSDNRDDSDFPTRGFYLNARGKFIDIFDRKEQKLGQVDAHLQINIPLAERFAYGLNLYGGLTLSDETPSSYYKFYAGGIFGQNLGGNFMNFQGYHFGNLAVNNLVIASNHLQMKIKKNYFLTGHFSIINPFNDHTLKSILKISHFSGGITAGYKSPFGQIKLNYSRASDRNRGVFSVILGHWF